MRGLVARGPLFDRLSAAGPGEVVLVCAPAGSGKTVLLRSWVESTGRRRPRRLDLRGTGRARCAGLLAVGHRRAGRRRWLRRARRCDAGVRRRGGRRAAAVRPPVAGPAGRAADRRSARAALDGGAAVARAVPRRAAAAAARGAGDARGPRLGPAPDAARRGADRDPRERSAVLARGDARAPGRERGRALRTAAWSCSTSGRKAGPRVCAWRPSRWPGTPTRSAA